MIVDILPIPNNYNIEVIDTSTVGFDLFHRDNAMMFGRALPIDLPNYQYKIIEATEFGIVERTIITFEEWNLRTLLSDDNKPVELYPISVRYFNYGLQTDTVKVFKFAKSIGNLIENFGGNSTMTMGKRLSILTIDCMKESPWYETFRRNYKGNRYLIESICRDDVTSLEESLQGVLIHGNLSFVGFDINQSYIDIINQISSPIVYAMHEKDYLSYTCLSDDIIPSDYIRSCLGANYKVRPYSNNEVTQKEHKFDDTWNYSTSHDVVNCVINYLDRSIYTDLSITIGPTTTETLYLNSRYTKIKSVEVFENDMRKYFDVLYTNPSMTIDFNKSRLINVWVTKSYLEEVFITFCFEDGGTYKIHMNMVLHNLGTHALVDR